MDIVDDAGMYLARHDLLGGFTGQGIEPIQDVLNSEHGLWIGGTTRSATADIRRFAGCAAALGNGGLGAEGVGTGGTSMDVVRHADKQGRTHHC